MAQGAGCRAKLAIVACLMIGLAYISRASAAAQAFPEYLSGVQIANLETSDAQVVLTLYSDSGEVLSMATDLIAANESRTYFPISEVLGSGCAGLDHVVQGTVQAEISRFVFPRTGCTLVITSNQRLAAVVNLVSSDFRAGGSYRYESTGANIVYLPLLNKNNSGFNTWFTVQNLGAGVANIQVRYSDGTEAAASLAKDKAHTFYQAQENHTQQVFAGTVTSDQPVFVFAIQESANIIFSYAGFASGATNPVFPLINVNNAGYVTGLQIQNIGEQATTVEISYTPSVAGTPCKETQTIGAGLATTFALAAFENGANSDCAAKQTFVGSAQVTSNSANQPLAGIGNQLLPGINGAAYRALDPLQATHTVVMPLIMDRNSGFFTGFSLQNVGSESATVQCTFINNSAYTLSKLLVPGESLYDIQQNKLASQYVGGAICTADTSTARIVAIVNELSILTNVDHLLAYEGVPGQ
jgi:hypothetical protein